MTAALPAPGPWFATGNSAYKTVLKDARGHSIASGGNNRAIQGEELEASLVLASAAPDLLAALEEIVKNDPFNQSSAGIIARAAIAKATGEPT